MPHLTLNVAVQGPLLDLAVGVSLPHANALKKAGKPIPKPVRIRGLIDTGASTTCVDPDAIRSLALTSKGQTRIHTPSTQGRAQTCDQYDVSIILDHPQLSKSLYAISVIASRNLSIQGLGALIGRDVLSGCLLVYDGRQAHLPSRFDVAH